MHSSTFVGPHVYLTPELANMQIRTIAPVLCCQSRPNQMLGEVSINDIDFEIMSFRGSNRKILLVPELKLILTHKPTVNDSASARKLFFMLAIVSLGSVQVF